MNIERVRDALDKFDKLSDGEVLNAGSLRMFPPIVAASELVDAPRMWWCETDGFSEERSRRCWTFTHDGCGWVRVVKEDN